MGNDVNKDSLEDNILDDEDNSQSFKWLFGDLDDDLDENEPVSFNESSLAAAIPPTELGINLPTLYTLSKDETEKVVSIKFDSKNLTAFLQKCDPVNLKPLDSKTKELKTKYVKELDDYFKDNNENMVLSLYIKLQPEQELKKIGEINLAEKEKYETIGDFILRKTAKLFQAYKNSIDKIMDKKIQNEARLTQNLAQQQKIKALQEKQYHQELENSAGRGH
ncbi:hypothetical protein [Spiroplasma sp. DGKH1]|uniref:hypothetical protein n=1 Tax=Spiroplasma sp. DGKH1 TaxID=3050074 RepID=UPI0034C5EC7C